MQLYIRDNFFGKGVTPIENEQGENVGSLDLRSAFGSSLDVYDANGRLRCTGSFRFFSNKWRITGPEEAPLGVVRSRLALMRKRFEYDAEGRGLYEITSPAFSGEYELLNESGGLEARFEKVSGWLRPGAYRLDNLSERLDSYELAAVIMGVHQIRKRQSSQAAGSAGH